MRKFNFKKFSFSWQAVLDRLIEANLAAVLFLVPLYFSNFLITINVFELNKSVLFRILLSLVFLLTVTREVFYPSSLGRRLGSFFKKYWLWPTVFIFSLGFLLLFSGDRTLSFFGSITRQQGFSQYLFYFFWFILFSFNLAVFSRRPATEYNFQKIISRLILVIVFSGAGVSLYGVLQILNIDYYAWDAPIYLTARAFSSLGQPNFFASWLLLVIPLSVYLFQTTKKFLLRFFYLLLFLLNLAGLISSSSRGGLVSFCFLLLLFLLYLLFFNNLAAKKKAIIVLAFILFAAVSLVAVNKIIPGRVASMFDFNQGSSDARFNFYSAAISAIKQKPLWGYGQENSSNILVTYYQPDWGVSSNVGQFPDRAHNLFLDILLSGGIFALAAYSLLYFFFFGLAFKNIKAKNQVALFVALSLGAAAYLFSLLFSFSIPTGEIYFFSYLAIFVGLDFANLDFSGRQLPRQRLFLKKYWRFLLFFLVLVFSIWSISKTVKILLADYYFTEGKIAFSSGNYFKGLTLFDYVDSLDVNPVNQAFYDSAVADLVLKVYPFKGELALQKVLQDRLLKIAAALPEKQTVDLLTKAKVNIALENFTAAEKYLTVIKNRTPLWPFVYLTEAKLKVSEGKPELAAQAYYLALVNLPDVYNIYLNEEHRNIIHNFRYEIFYSLAEIYAAGNNFPLAEKYYLAAYAEHPLNFTVLKKIADWYYRQGKLTEALKYSLRGFRLSPQDYNWPLMISYLYDDLKSPAEANVWRGRAAALGYQIK
jgi:putative inorganic carbon (HCO3(-)) transporter